MKEHFAEHDSHLNPTDMNYSYAELAKMSQILFFINFFWSAFKGKKAGENPWQSAGLEWTTPNPPPHGNWPGEIPEAYRGPYDYSVPGAPADFVSQTDPSPLGERAGAH